MSRTNPPTGAFAQSDAGSPSWEDNDCAVRAMVSATGRRYEECHALLKAAGRKDRKATAGRVLGAALGLHFVRTGYRAGVISYKDSRPTFAQLSRKLGKGIYIVFVTDHFLALVDGVHVDQCPSLYKPRARCHGYWKVA